MQVLISFRHMDASPALRDYAEEKIERVIRKYIRDNFDAQVTLSVEKFRHKADILLSYKGLSIKCEGSSEDMYASVDLALDKLERQIRRYKSKLRRHQPSEGRDRLFELSVIRAPADDEIEDEMDGTSEDVPVVEEEAPEPEAPPEAPAADVHVLQKEVMAAKPMSVDDAMMQLDLEQRAFMVFTNSETNAFNVLYRRDDGNFGLIVPQ